MSSVEISIDHCVEKNEVLTSWETWGLYVLMLHEDNCAESGELFASPGQLDTIRGESFSTFEDLEEGIGLDPGELWEAFINVYYDDLDQPPETVYFSLEDLLEP